ncbi:type II secretion system minor pseudopilin GspK [Legionella maceachernii]|uniref:Type II secretion system protein K n=1 Tax=Legionella maceachernii TaxID=466 RepID=A0A0W0WE97_9GAMM|nr:type II secretion system minor pseudopilin GspK [Legionella maceachernii]KTD30648.1 type II secretory pathway protein [Legionella maceachernii]SJZ81299.1 general secretion pathway protein K [Legionella maceachernii]SUP02795.1 Type II secretory pathway, component PulK [Legionella maceachernii]
MQKNNKLLTHTLSVKKHAAAEFRGKSNGSALISALFIMTLVAIAATAMSTRLQLDIYRTRLTIMSDKLYLASQAVSFWAMSELTHSKNQFTISDEFGKVLDFPKQFKSIYPDILLKGELYDLQSRFNLNNISEQKYQLPFLHLLKQITPLNQQQREELRLILNNWLTPYQPGQDNEISLYYMKQKPPYYPAQQLMRSVSEFRLLKGISAKLYRRLLNQMTVLPESTPININTASRPVLTTLGYGLTTTQVNELIKARGKKGITNLKQITPILKKLNIRDEQITLASQYFMSIARVSSADLNLTVYSVFKRNKDKKGQVSVSVISESFNTFG